MQRPDVEEFIDWLGEERFDKWFTYYRIAPWGPIRDDNRLKKFAAISGVPGDVEYLTQPSSFEAIRKLTEIFGTGTEGEQQSLESVVEVLKGALSGRRPGNQPFSGHEGFPS